MALIVSGLAPSVRVLLPEFFFSSRRRNTRFKCDWSSDLCSSDLSRLPAHAEQRVKLLCAMDALVCHLAWIEVPDPGHLLRCPLDRDKRDGFHQEPRQPGVG